MPDRAVATTPAQYQPHPIAACWPPIEGAEFDALCHSVKTHGLLHAIVLYDGLILDGRNRYRACLAVGVEPRFVSYDGNDPLGFALASNDQRRHLDASQRAMVAARLAQLAKGVRPDASGDACGTTQTQAADLLHVGRAQVQRARVVQEQAVSELVSAVDLGLITVATAARLVDEPVEIQRTIVDAVAGGSSVSAAIHAVKGDGKEAVVTEMVDAESAALDERQVYVAYQALEPAAQERVFKRIHTERTKADRISAAKAESERREKFKLDLARVSGGRSVAIDDPLMAALAEARRGP